MTSDNGHGRASSSPPPPLPPPPLSSFPSHNTHQQYHHHHQQHHPQSPTPPPPTETCSVSEVNLTSSSSTGKGGDPNLPHPSSSSSYRHPLAYSRSVGVEWSSAAQQQELAHEKKKRLPPDNLELDKDYSYVKFPPRAHEYSYPKLVDALSDGGQGHPANNSGGRGNTSGGGGGGTGSNSGGIFSNVSTSISTTLSSSTTSCCKPPPLPSTTPPRKGQSPVPKRIDSISKKKGSPPLLPPHFSSSSGGGSSSGSSSSSSAKTALGPSSGGVGMMGPGSCRSADQQQAPLYTCAHCRESFSLDSNPRGSCQYAPDCLRKGIEAVTCLQCAKCLLYHCMSDSEGDYVHPCECSNVDGHRTRRWIGLTFLSILVPCLCCYLPLMACYKCGMVCNVCGGKHQPP